MSERPIYSLQFLGTHKDSERNEVGVFAWRDGDFTEFRPDFKQGVSMNETTKQALLSIERCLDMNKTRPSSALAAAYQLGRIDGMLEMAEVGEDLVAEMRKKVG